MTRIKWILALAALATMTFSLQAADKVYKLTSPSGELAVEVTAGKALSWSVERQGTKVLHPSELSMTLEDGTVFGKDMKGVKAVRSSVNRTLVPVVYMQEKVQDVYNQLTLKLKGYSVEFRAYDDGAAYRFVAARKAPFKVTLEQAVFNFGQDTKGYIPYTRKTQDNIECQFFTSFESLYSRISLSEWESDRLAFLPVTLDAPDGMKVCITESDLLNYPGMYLSNQDKDASLEAVFAPYPKDIEQGGHNMLQGLVRTRENYIADVAADESFPWRIVIVAKEDKDLLDCDLPWLLGREPARDADFSWVKPGKVAWDWWNAWNIYGVDFKAGINNDTYKYYIDFASKSGIEYVILDEGWAVNKKADLFQVIPEIDLPMLCKYAASKNVGLILWAGYWAFNKDMERACREYSEMGVKGFKVDFMDRDDQPMVQFYRRTAEMAAKYHLIIDFHGAFKPAGLQRTWPNVVNMEGVFGLENAKNPGRNEKDLVAYEATIPFVRLVAGPSDYTQGAMRNANKRNFRYVSSEAMSQGTRCRQLAEYVIFYAPLTMLCDSPSNYMKEKECLSFIAGVPTVWDETLPLEGKAGEYVSLARRKGDVWYVGAIGDWNAREMTLDLSFIGGEAWMEIFRDGANADRAARDYKRELAALPADGKVKLQMAPGGGWAAVIRRGSIPPEQTDADWAKFNRYEQKNKEVVGKPVAVLMGDSITQGWAREDGAWLDGHKLVGRGISGQTTSQMLVRFRRDVIELQPEYVIILAGINDIARNNGYITVENAFNNIVSMVELAQVAGIKPILCTLTPAHEIGWRKRLGDPRPLIAQMNSLIVEYAAAHGIPVVDYHSAMKTKDGAMIPEYRRDAVHPNLSGYEAMEKVLLEVLQQCKK
ncbi:MAG: glycoside hydrolase family 97 catalytic domain-containing protein [Bacteroidales bacterium]|nr:glycoside hydrolase family 97 catalytic domain-containing protein [Bacteroidales bacterium]